MKPLLNISLRYKLPIWGAVLIAVTTIVISLALVSGVHGRVRDNVAVNALVVVKAVETTLLPALINDDIWGAYQSLVWLVNIDNPIDAATIHPHNLVVVDEQQRILVSARPKQFPMFAELKTISAEYARIAPALPGLSTAKMKEIDFPDTQYFHFARRLNSDGATLIISYPKQVLSDRFNMLAGSSALAGLLTLLLLLPISWYWGRRLSLPLVAVAEQFRALNAPPTPSAIAVRYEHQDEVGQLYDSYVWMLQELEGKKLLQDQVVRSERLVAVGQLAAGVAHEINNPLSGMLTAIDTLKEYGQGDFHTMKTIGLVERGLLQIKEIVGALLVQADVKGRPLGRDDVEDIRVLMKLQADKKHVDLSVTCEMPSSVPIAATAARQIMINLLLNALQAVPVKGRVTLRVIATDTALEIAVGNDGDPIPPDRLQGIFEPFSGKNRSGHGLGLWITYQIISQLHGRIHVERLADMTCFSVTLPLEVPA